MSIELIYDKDCPNVPQARENLMRALNTLGRALHWREWDRADRNAPDYVQGYGSPTILINKKDLACVSATDAACCRIYTNEHGAKQGIPPVSLIVSALNQTTRRGMGRNAASLLPAVGTALMPKLVCPVCWPAYTALLSSMSVGFINYTPFLLPLTGAFLLVVLILLAWRAGTRRGYWPFSAALLASIVILIGKFLFESDAAIYAGVIVLVAASVWNAWPRQRVSTPCPDCVVDRGINSGAEPKGGS